MRERSAGPWVPLVSKLVWPIFILLLMAVFQDQVREVYGVLLEAMRSGRSVEIGGFLRLGDAAQKTTVADLTLQNLPVEAIGGSGGVVRKGSVSALERLQEELRQSPDRAIDTLLLNDDTVFSLELLRQYVSTLGLQFVVFQRGGAFDGWMRSSAFVAQLPEGGGTIRYGELRNVLVGVRKEKVPPGATAKEVLERMQTLHAESLPVVEEDRRWLFFAHREEILARLMASLILEDEK